MALTMRLAVFIGLLCEGVLYGVYTTLAGGALYLLIRKRPAERYTRTNVFMVTLTVLMYCACTVHIALSIKAAVPAFVLAQSDQPLSPASADPGSQALVESPNDPTVWIQLLLELLNCQMGDLIVCYRTWELWNRRTSVLLFPVVCIVGGVVSGSGVTYAMSRLPNGMQLITDKTVIVWFAGFASFTVLLNVYSVSMTAWKGRAKMRELKQTNMDIAGGAYFTALGLVIESGAVYCIALAVTFALFMADNISVYIMADVVVQLTGIYPTIIIVLVCLSLTFTDNVRRSKTHTPRARAPRHSDARSEHAVCHKHIHSITVRPSKVDRSEKAAQSGKAGESSRFEGRLGFKERYELKPLGEVAAEAATTPELESELLGKGPCSV
ncbi:hypothetical protein C8Q80DRAFT_953347 [Daedaleopsis nitida]|nr:hypothetical protein C8Q80DRAFT_953347 [Daedaleopsis nitida]